jgi:hypothetical protein
LSQFRAEKEPDMSIPPVTNSGDQRRLTVFTLLIMVLAAITTGVLGLILIDDDGGAVEAQAVRQYQLEVKPADIDYGGGNVWHAWTYNGTVPARLSPQPSVRSSWLR